MRITALAPWSMAYFIVGSAPTMRWVLVTLELVSLSRGTLKSTYRQILVFCSAMRDMATNDSTHPNEDSLVLDIDVGDGELVGERHCCGFGCSRCHVNV